MIKKYLNKIMAFGIHMDFFYTKGYKLEVDVRKYIKVQVMNIKEILPIL